MKWFKKFNSIAEAVGTVHNTPFVAIVKDMKNKALFAGQKSGNEIKICSKDDFISFKNSKIVMYYNVTTAGENYILGSRTNDEKFDVTQVREMYVDGSTTAVSPALSTNFATTGTHSVKFMLNDGITNLSRLKDSYDCVGTMANLTKADLSEADLDNNETMFCVFQSCSSLTSISLPALPNVTNMRSCFYSCNSLTSISLPALPNVTDMIRCFYGCSAFTNISLPALPKVTNMSRCFYGCTSLTSISLSALPNVTDMYCCFAGCSSLTSISLPALPNVTDMGNCFLYCSSLQNLTISALPNYKCLSNWGISSCTALTVSSLVNILNALPNTSGGYTCTLGTTNLNKLTADQKAIATGKGWTLN